VFLDCNQLVERLNRTSPRPLALEALYGMTFDFNKTTLRADSEGVLQQILALLQSDAPLIVEVQGHTDNVGSDDYNLTLSQGRADAVKAWLVSHVEHQLPTDNATVDGRVRNSINDVNRPCA